MGVGRRTCFIEEILAFPTTLDLSKVLHGCEFNVVGHEEQWEKYHTWFKSMASVRDCRESHVPHIWETQSRERHNYRIFDLAQKLLEISD